MSSLPRSLVPRFLVPRRRQPLVILALLVVLALLYMGSQPVAVGLFQPPWDKLAHFVVYGGIAALCALGLADLPPWVPVALVAGIGLLDESLQALEPGRTPDLGDFLADVTAALCAVVVVVRLTERRKRARVPVPGPSCPQPE